MPLPEYWRAEQAPDFPDREVSCRVTRFLFDYAEEKGVDLEGLAVGVRYPREHLIDPSRRIGWASFRLLMANVGKLWPDAELRRLGRHAARSRWARPFGLVLRRFWSLRGIFRASPGSRPGPGNLLVTCLQEGRRELEPNHYEVELSMHEGYEPCREFFVAAAGFLEAWPDVLGLKPAVVHMTETEAGARYDVRMSEPWGLLSLLRQAVLQRIGRGRPSAELQDTLEFLQAGYLELQDHIVSRRRAEEALRRSEERFRRLTENARDLIDEIDMQGRLLYVSPNHRQVTGHDPDELLGTSAFDLLDPEDLPAGREALARLVRTKLVQPEVFRVRHRDGTPLWFETTANLFTTDSGETRVVIVSRDVTEHRRAEMEQRRLEAQVRHSQKLESLGVLAGGIAHDFNNLLTPILGYVEQALAELDQSSAVRVSLERVKSGALRAAELTNQLLIHAGESQFVMGPVDLSHVVGEMTTLLETASGRWAELRCDLATDLPPIEADAAQVRQVVMNLLTNAAEAIGQHAGSISVCTGTMWGDAGYLARALPGARAREGSYVYLEVSDTGCGMDPETRERMFEPFFSTKFSGRGLGLSALLGIMHGHGGAVMVDSEQGRGTTVRVLFPTGARASERASREPSVNDDGLEGAVLVVDDDAEVRDVARWMLESAGMTVLVAGSGCEAIDLFSRQPHRFSVVLLDVTMPRMSGWDVLRAIRQLRPSVPVLVASGYGEKHVTDRAPEDRSIRFIQKPFTRDALIRGVRGAVDAASPPGSP